MFDFLIIYGASEMVPKLRYYLSKQGLSISHADSIGNVTVAVNEETKGFRIKKSDIQDMMREIEAVLEKYNSVSTKRKGKS